MVEADRDLVNSMRSAVSARGGLVVTLSIWGRGPFVAELVNRRGQDGVVIHLYQADADAKIDDESQWLKANPGAGDPGIKQLSSLRADCQNAITNPLEQSAFRCNELNLPGVPSEEMLISLTDWRAVTVQAAALPPRSGRVCIGFDIGGSTSLCALVAIWESGRLEAYAGLPDNPGLAERGKLDGCGNDYVRMAEEGSLKNLRRASHACWCIHGRLRGAAGG